MELPKRNNNVPLPFTISNGGKWKSFNDKIELN